MTEGFFFLLVSLNSQVEFLELICRFLNHLKPFATDHGLLQLERTLVVKSSS
jgi:hypothetical protein